MLTIELERWYNDSIIVAGTGVGLKPGDVVLLPFVVKTTCPALGDNYYEVERLGRTFTTTVPQAQTPS